MMGKVWQLRSKAKQDDNRSRDQSGKKQVSDSSGSFDSTRKSPRLNKCGRTRGQTLPLPGSRRTGTKDVQPARAIRSMKFSKPTEIDKGDSPEPWSGRRATLRSPNIRKAAERASEDIAVDLILEDETDEETKSSCRGNDVEDVADAIESVAAELADEPEDNGAVAGNEIVATRRGRKSKRKRNPRRSAIRTEAPGDYRQDDVEHEFAEDDERAVLAEQKSEEEEGESEDGPSPPSSKKAKVKTSMLEKLQDSSGFVDRVEISLKPEDLVPMRRTPRMASLNALAKVSAVLDSYSLATPKSSAEMKKPREKKLNSCGSTRGDRHERKSLSSLGCHDRNKGALGGAYKSKRRRCTSLSTHPDHCRPTKNGSRRSYWSERVGVGHPYFYEADKFYDAEFFSRSDEYIIDDEQPISDNHVSSTSTWALGDSTGVTKKDKAVQTMVNHKAVQTDAYLLQGYRAISDAGPRTCRCGNRKLSNYSGSNTTRKVFGRIPPRITSPAVDVPLKSSLFAKTDLHTISIPFTKRHILSHTDLKDVGEIDSQNLDMNRNKRIASLNAVAMMNAMVVLDQPYSALLHDSYLYRHSHPVPIYEKEQGAPLKIPKINYAATSTSNFTSSNKTKGHLPLNYKALQPRGIPSSVVRRGPPSSPKMVNGWMFDGEPIEKPFEYDDRIVLRRYYSSMRRNNEVINVRDSVLLKSGTKKKDMPFVARVAAIWEEESDDSVSDMTISVFWYYRPEQTEIGRMGNFHGEMEVLASRHRDDNSVACIVDKCYVLSYPQYCRFRARSKLYRESRRTPLSPVPPAESTRPGSMPPPNTDPSLVFFCRQVYDFRTGRILKNPFY